MIIQCTDEATQLWSGRAISQPCVQNFPRVETASLWTPLGAWCIVGVHWGLLSGAEAMAPDVPPETLWV